MSTQIHPTAIVDAKTNLGVEVKIGPYAIVEAGCVIGDYCEIRAHAIVGRGTLMGPRNQIGYGVVMRRRAAGPRFQERAHVGGDRLGQQDPRVRDDPPRDEGGHGDVARQ